MDPNQIINFLDPKFDTIVKCSCAVEDFYPIENLISNDKQKLNRGFMAYRVVKPPIQIEFQLNCCIELVSIKIWPRIDSLKSTGFEIFINSDMAQQYYKAASHHNLQENGIQFINSSINSCSNDNEDEDFAVVPFFPSTKNQLRKVTNIKLTIKQTTRQCVPVIKRLEIWGKISKFATVHQKESISKIIAREIVQTQCVKMTENSTNDDTSSFRLNEHLEDNLEIPEAFLDTITFEIMALPMVLPSGKIIDNSTLLKHIEQEEKWGRVPSDPFTFQPFTDSRKPVLNVHLKAQIDSFLLKNCSVQSIARLPRTVGSITKRRIEQSEECSKDSKMAKSDCISQEKNTKSYHCTDETVQAPLPQSIVLPSSSTISTASLSSLSSSSSSSSAMKSQSLDEAIRGVLKIGKYTANIATQNDSNIKKCFQCPEMVNNTLYTIRICSHLICRDCLVKKNISICKCGKSFSNIDVIKHHNKIIL